MDKITSMLSSAAVALLIATLSGLGVGSGGLLVIWLTLLGGVAPETARGLNLLFFVFSSGSAMIVHSLKGRIRIKNVVFLALFACIGTLLGAFIGTHTDSAMLKKIFGAMLFISGAYTLMRNLKGEKMKRKARE